MVYLRRRGIPPQRLAARVRDFPTHIVERPGLALFRLGIPDRRRWGRGMPDVANLRQSSDKIGGHRRGEEGVGGYEIEEVVQLAWTAREKAFEAMRRAAGLH